MSDEDDYSDAGEEEEEGSGEGEDSEEESEEAEDPEREVVSSNKETKATKDEKLKKRVNAFVYEHRGNSWIKDSLLLVLEKYVQDIVAPAKGNVHAPSLALPPKNTRSANRPVLPLAGPPPLPLPLAALPPLPLPLAAPPPLPLPLAALPPLPLPLAATPLLPPQHPSTLHLCLFHLRLASSCCCCCHRRCCCRRRCCFHCRRFLCRHCRRSIRPLSICRFLLRRCTPHPSQQTPLPSSRPSRHVPTHSTIALLSIRRRPLPSAGPHPCRQARPAVQVSAAANGGPGATGASARRRAGQRVRVGGAEPRAGRAAAGEAGGAGRKRGDAARVQVCQARAPHRHAHVRPLK